MILGHELPALVVVVFAVIEHPRDIEVLTVLQLVEPDFIEAQETQAFVTVDLAVQDGLVLVIEEVPSSPWSSFGSILIYGHELAEEVVIVFAVISHPLDTTVLMVRQLVEPEVMVAQDFTKSVTVEIEHDDVFEDVLDDRRLDVPWLCDC